MMLLCIGRRVYLVRLSINPLSDSLVHGLDSLPGETINPLTDGVALGVFAHLNNSLPKLEQQNNSQTKNKKPIKFKNQDLLAKMGSVSITNGNNSDYEMKTNLYIYERLLYSSLST